MPDVIAVLMIQIDEEFFIWGCLCVVWLCAYLVFSYLYYLINIAPWVGFPDVVLIPATWNESVSFVP